MISYAFDFDQLHRNLVGKSRTELIEAVERELVAAENQGIKRGTSRYFDCQSYISKVGNLLSYLKIGTRPFDMEDDDFELVRDLI